MILTPCFKLSPESPLPALPRLEHLTVSPHELHRILRRASSQLRATEDRARAGVPTPVFMSLTGINFTSLKASDHLYLDQHGESPSFTAYPGEPLLRRTTGKGMPLPRLSALVCPLALKSEFERLDLPLHLWDRTLWHVGWQDFVDYMPPWRAFALDGDTDNPGDRPASLRLRHLYILPLPYDPLPRHFLDELARRIESDPSLHALARLYLPRKGWGPLLLSREDAAGSSTSNPEANFPWAEHSSTSFSRGDQGRLAFLRACETKGVSLVWVGGTVPDEKNCGGDEQVLMPEEYRRWALAQGSAGDQMVTQYP